MFKPLETIRCDFEACSLRLSISSSPRMSPLPAKGTEKTCVFGIFHTTQKNKECGCPSKKEDGSKGSGHWMFNGCQWSIFVWNIFNWPRLLLWTAQRPARHGSKHSPCSRAIRVGATAVFDVMGSPSTDGSNIDRPNGIDWCQAGEDYMKSTSVSHDQSSKIDKWLNHGEAVAEIGCLQMTNNQCPPNALSRKMLQKIPPLEGIKKLNIASPSIHTVQYAMSHFSGSCAERACDIPCANTISHPQVSDVPPPSRTMKCALVKSNQIRRFKRVK